MAKMTTLTQCEAIACLPDGEHRCRRAGPHPGWPHKVTLEWEDGEAAPAPGLSLRGDPSDLGREAARAVIRVLPKGMRFCLVVYAADGAYIGHVGTAGSSSALARTLRELALKLEDS